MFAMLLPTLGAIASYFCLEYWGLDRKAAPFIAFEVLISIYCLGLMGSGAVCLGDVLDRWRGGEPFCECARCGHNARCTCYRFVAYDRKHSETRSYEYISRETT